MALLTRHGWLRWLGAIRFRHQLDSLLGDARYSIRTIRKTAALSSAVVVTLVVGVGMNAVVFSLFNALLFRPHVTRDPASYVQIYANLSGRWYRDLSGPPSLVTLEDYQVIRDDSRAMSDVTVSRWASFMLDDGASGSVRGMFVSCNYLSAHIGAMRLGRSFVAADCSEPGSAPVVVLSDLAWRRYFARDPAIIGHVLRLNDRVVTVVGIAPDFETGGPIAAMVYLPYTMQPVLQGPVDYFRDPPALHAWLSLSGRLRAGQSRGDLQAELRVIAKRLDRLHPGQVTEMIVTDGAIINEPETRRRMPMLLVLCIGTTILILLMVCANVTTLLLARAVTRRREMAVRAALGGGRVQLLRQLLMETVLLAGCAGAIGSALAYSLSVRLAQALTDFPLLDNFSPDWRVFGFTFGLAFLAGCVAGMMPALEALRFSLSDAMRSAGRGTGGPVRAGLRGTLIANQLSISLALLIAVGSIVRAQDRLLHATLDYDAEATLVTAIDLSRAGYTGVTARAFYDRLIPSLETLPGVRAVGLSSPPPFAGISRRAITIEGVAGQTVLAPARAVSPSYFPIVGVQLLRGRFFTDLESRAATPVMPLVVSASFAKGFFPGRDGIGGRIRLGNDDRAEIVGIVSDTASVRPTEPDEPMIYQPIYAANVAGVTPVLQATGDVRPLMQAIRARVRTLDARLSARPEPIARLITREADRYSAVTKMTALPAAVALFLALAGVYGLTTFAAAIRKQEIGVRTALGATTRDIVVLFLRSLRGPFIAALFGGVAMATVGILALSRTGVMAEISLGDPMAYGAAVALLICTAAGATLVPAVRAARAAPWSALQDS